VTFTLLGRLQTRLVLVATVGVAWTWVVTPFIPSSSLAQMGMANIIMTKFMTTIPVGPQQSLLFVNYQMSFETLGVMAGLGLGWEFVYHALQQLRWDRDWPSLFMLLAVVPEGVALWYVAHLLGVFPPGTLGMSSPEMEMYVIHLATVWVVMWLWLQGPQKVVVPRWRFQGGELWRLSPRGIGWGSPRRTERRICKATTEVKDRGSRADETSEV